MRKSFGLLAAFAMIVSACTGTTSDDSSTTSFEPGTTPTTAPPESTTTSGPVASTTSQLPTTTTSLVAGIWAEQPLITHANWGGMALGWWDGSAWVQVDENTALPVSGGEDYQIALLGSEGVLQGGPQTNTGCDVVVPDGLPSILLSDEEALSTAIDDGSSEARFVYGVAISAPWDLTPRPVEPAQAVPEFEDDAVGLLEELAYPTETVQLRQMLNVDIDGDGTVETLVVAEETELANQNSDVYSIVFVTGSGLDPAVIESSVIPPTDTGFPASFRISAVADLNGDGTMEVVLDGEAWENSWVGIYELTPAGFVPRIGAGCGV